MIHVNLFIVIIDYTCSIQNRNLKLDDTSFNYGVMIIRKRYSVYRENWAKILVSTIPTIFIILSTLPSTHAFTFNNIDPTKFHLSDAQESIAPSGVNMGRIILYSLVIAIVIFTRLKWNNFLTYCISKAETLSPRFSINQSNSILKLISDCSITER
jgi:hypothetical protein